MNKKKGFTLVELIAVISILAIIITIAGISITSIKKDILSRERVNLQTEIKSAAQSYHDETGVSVVPVGVLLQIGSLQADTMEYEDDNYDIGEPVILDPVDGNPINCDAVIFDAEGNSKYEYDEGCTSDALAENKLGITIQADGETVYKNEEKDPYDGTTWIKLSDSSKTVTVEARASLYEGESEYTWINMTSPDTSYIGNILTITIPDSGYVDTEYTVITTINGVEVNKTFRIKIDPKAPTIENYYITDEETWKTSKGIYANVIDNESGLKAYAITNKKCDELTNSDYISLEGEKNIQIKLDPITINGKYNICVKDEAGHVSKVEDKINITKVDSESPKLTVSVPNGNTWAKSRTANITLEDFGNEEYGKTEKVISGFNSGTFKFKYVWSATEITDCNSTSVSWNEGTFNLTDTDTQYTTSITIDGVTGNGKVYVCPKDNSTYKIVDKVGNQLEYKPYSKDADGKDAVAKLDNTAPLCGTATSNDGSFSWTNKSRTISQPCNDQDASGTTQSGCVKTSYGNTYSSSQTTDTITIKDNVGNESKCSYNVNVDTDAPTCGSVTGASSSWTNNNRTITQGCSDTGGSGCKGTYSTTYKTSTKTDYKVIYDNAGNSTTCSTYNVYVDKDAPTCKVTQENTTCTSGSVTGKVSCSDTGGSGCKLSTYSKKFTETAYYGYIDVYDNAGNSNECRVNVYLDNDEPYVKSSTFYYDEDDEDLYYSYRLRDTGCSDDFDYGYKMTYRSSYPSVTLNRYIDYDWDCDDRVYWYMRIEDTAGNDTGVFREDWTDTWCPEPEDDDEDYDYDDDEDEDEDDTASCACPIIESMISNSRAWQNATETQRANWHTKNETLANKLSSQCGLSTCYDCKGFTETGYWYVSNMLLYTLSTYPSSYGYWVGSYTTYYDENC